LKVKKDFQRVELRGGGTEVGKGGGGRGEVGSHKKGMQQCI